MIIVPARRRFSFRLKVTFMALPKLPQYSTPPSVPRTSASSSGETRQKGGCFNIVLMFCLAWLTITFFAKKKEPAPLPEENLPQTVQVQPKGEEDLAAIAETLSPELKEEARQEIGPQFITLGSLDPSSPYRMLVTISNHGAAVTRVEMNEKGLRDCADASGYLGQIIADETVAADEILSGLPGRSAVKFFGAASPILYS